MNYWIVLFIKPEAIDSTGPQKWQISQLKFEKICQSGVNMIQLEDSVYRLDDKKIFSIEHENPERSHCFIVCEAHKMKQPT